jgi:3,4-dihydroxy 2-butanone 4-phosphate synthase/3,4-dihydroxy 2-butanone 4-phosphate synthase/GTP cyclohydrolase II
VFTGRVSQIGVVVAAHSTDEGTHLVVRGAETASQLQSGGSVAVAGVRLTVASVNGDRFEAVVGAETAARTTLRGDLIGRHVNLELPLRAGDPLDGHLVQGHVEGTAKLISRRDAAGAQYVWFRPNRRLIREMVAKGSIAVDGVSLTIVEINKGGFSVALIPETRRRTTLDTLPTGAEVNVETDVLPRYQQLFGRRPAPELAWSGLHRGAEAVEKAISTIAAGGKVVVWDPVREAEGDVIMAADRVSPADVNFLMTHARGLICAPMDLNWLQRLDIPRLEGTGGLHGTAFMMPVDAAEGLTTGMPSSERARTLRLLASPASTSASFVRPGHIFPLAAHPRGLPARAGHTEAAVALARLAGRPPVAVCCEIAAADGEMARLPELELFAARHGLPMLAIDDLTAYIQRRPPEAAILDSAVAG